MNVGVLRGGTRVNMVADHAECEVEMRLPSWPRSASSKPRSAASQIRWPCLARKPSSPAGSSTTPWRSLPIRSHCGDCWRLAGHEIGFDVRRVATGGASDGNTTSRFVPTIDGMGPRGDFAHSPEEYIVVASLAESTKALARFLELWHRAAEPDGCTPATT